MSRVPFVLCAVSLLVSLVASLPVAQEESQVVQLPLELQEALAKLQLAEQTYEEAPRDKRTIATLRQLFPGLSQIIDRKIQMITQYLFRVIGRAVLRGALNGGGGASNNSTSGGGERRISITLPTYPPLAEDEMEADTEIPTTEATETETPASI